MFSWSEISLGRCVHLPVCCVSHLLHYQKTTTTRFTWRGFWALVLLSKISNHCCSVLFRLIIPPVAHLCSRLQTDTLYLTNKRKNRNLKGLAGVLLCGLHATCWLKQNLYFYNVSVWSGVHYSISNAVLTHIQPACRVGRQLAGHI